MLRHSNLLSFVENLAIQQSENKPFPSIFTFLLDEKLRTSIYLFKVNNENTRTTCEFGPE